MKYSLFLTLGFISFFLCAATPTPSPSPKPLASPTATPCAATLNYAYPAPNPQQTPVAFTPESCALEQSTVSAICVPGTTLSTAQRNCVGALQTRRDAAPARCSELANSSDAQLEYALIDRQANYCSCLQGSVEDVEVLSAQLARTNCEL